MYISKQYMLQAKYKSEANEYESYISEPYILQAKYNYEANV